MPEIATYDFDVTKNEECFENIPYLDAQANDKVYMLLKQFGNLKLMKRSASYGGSEKELVISNGVGYQIKLYESETDQLEVHESLGANYTIYRVNPENESIPIVRGTITVNPRQGESVPAFRIEQRAMLYVTGTEMPDASKYPEGTVVSKNGVLYIQKSGAWEGVGGENASTVTVEETTGQGANVGISMYNTPALSEFGIYCVDYFITAPAYPDTISVGRVLAARYNRDRANGVNKTVNLSSLCFGYNWGDTPNQNEPTAFVGDGDIMFENATGTTIKILFTIRKISEIPL